ncbi:NADP-dependent oxidoreductase [Actinomadura macrotermitis]|uniref:Mycocerosic acid synthase n=1 Tax=Actinomadura macrotermitis TaxID=2585200 RepID=A0A7K0BTL1_9ACTN|nr:NADP-dependent oxidoreductase [Actinomadura macrotermitis]MQY04491.1 Mycocerosic acid synthase [Actinomadura macrotermitis]
MSTMKALVARGYGGVDALELLEVPRPVAGPGQIQVRIAAAALNPADVKLVTGASRDQVPLTFPHVLGSDFAGTVTAVGEGEGAGRFAPGDEVFGLALPRAVRAMAERLSTPPSLTTGTVAEYAVFEAAAPALAHRPAGLEAGRAASLPTAALTALPLLRAGDFAAGMTALIVGASGGVGSAVVPLLAARGVHVIATALPEDEEYVRGLGAAEVVDYRAAGTEAEVRRRRPKGVDALVNLALPGTSLPGLASLVRPGGRLLNTVFPDPGGDVRTVLTTARPGDLDEVAALALKGVLPSAVTRRHPLEQAASAYAHLVNGHVTGKVVVTTEGRLP